jgi:hypothetical protein
MLNCIDNSGAAVVECAKVLKMKRHAKIGTAYPDNLPAIHGSLEEDADTGAR